MLQLSDSPALSAHRSGEWRPFPPPPNTSRRDCDSGTPSTPSTALSPQTVVELFYQTVARKTIITQIYSQQQSPSLLHWSHMMSTVVHLLAQLLYPSGLYLSSGFQARKL